MATKTTNSATAPKALSPKQSAAEEKWNHLSSSIALYAKNHGGYLLTIKLHACINLSTCSYVVDYSWMYLSVYIIIMQGILSLMRISTKRMDPWL